MLWFSVFSLPRRAFLNCSAGNFNCYTFVVRDPKMILAKDLHGNWKLGSDFLASGLFTNLLRLH